MVGDRLWSRDEQDPDGPLALKVVEERFTRVAPIVNLHIRGQIIRTTAEHPFWREVDGWVSCKSLRIGDRLRLEVGWGTVEGVADSGDIVTVYNWRIADWHTYFVGADNWGFKLWAHNTGFSYGAFDLETVAKAHFPEGRAKGRVNLDPASSGEAVRVKAPGASIDVTATSSAADGKSYVIYAFVNKQTGNIDYVGRARTPSDVTDTSIQKAVQERLRGHKRDATLDPETQAVIVLDTQETYASHRGAEQVFSDLYESRGALERFTFAWHRYNDPETSRERRVE